MMTRREPCIGNIIKFVSEVFAATKKMFLSFVDCIDCLAYGIGPIVIGSVALFGLWSFWKTMPIKHRWFFILWGGGMVSFGVLYLLGVFS